MKSVLKYWDRDYQKSRKIQAVSDGKGTFKVSQKLVANQLFLSGKTNDPHHFCSFLCFFVFELGFCTKVNGEQLNSVQLRRCVRALTPQHIIN